MVRVSGLREAARLCGQNVCITAYQQQQLGHIPAQSVIYWVISNYYCTSGSSEFC